MVGSGSIEWTVGLWSVSDFQKQPVFSCPLSCAVARTSDARDRDRYRSDSQSRSGEFEALVKKAAPYQ